MTNELSTPSLHEAAPRSLVLYIWWRAVSCKCQEGQQTQKTVGRKVLFGTHFHVTTVNMFEPDLWWCRCSFIVKQSWMVMAALLGQRLVKRISASISRLARTFLRFSVFVMWLLIILTKNTTLKHPTSPAIFYVLCWIFLKIHFRFQEEYRSLKKYLLHRICPWNDHCSAAPGQRMLTTLTSLANEMNPK